MKPFPGAPSNHPTEDKRNLCFRNPHISFFIAKYPFFPKKQATECSPLVFSLLQANGHSFVHLEHEKAVLLLKSFQNTVDLVIQRELTV